jgi:MFS family permease
MKPGRSRHPLVRALLRDPLVLPFYLPSLVTFLGHGILSPVLPLYAEAFGASYAWVGAFMSAQALGMLLTDLPCGLLLRRLGVRRATVLGLTLMVVMEIAYFWAGSIQVAFAYRLLSGLGSALFGVARHAYVTEHASVAGRGRALALFGGLIRAGRFIGPPVGGLVAARWGLRAPLPGRRGGGHPRDPDGPLLHAQGRHPARRSIGAPHRLLVLAVRAASAHASRAG